MASLPALLQRMRIGAAALPLLLAGFLLGGLALPAQAQYAPFHTPVIDSVLAAEDAADSAAVQSDTSDGDQHASLRGLKALGAVVPSRLFEVLLVLAFMVTPVICAGGFAAVALFLDAGCLRMGLAVLGWGAALLGGLLIGGVLGTGLGALSVFGWAGVIAGGLGYPVLFLRARTKIKQLPQAEYLTWKHTLTGGALLGTGAGSALSVVRSAGALFKGSGGSFGGGGASGSFGGGQVAQVATASAQGASASSTVGLTSSAAPGVGAVSAGVASTRSAAAAADDQGRASSASGSRVKRVGRAVWRLVRRLRWYHGVAFVLVLLVFLPVGMGVGTVFQRPRLLLWIVGVYTLFRVPWLLVRSGIEVAATLYVVSLFVALAGIAMAAESQAPYRHLAIAGVIAGLVEVGYFVLPNTLPEVTAPSGREAPFRGGGASDRW
ncbi:MAG: hypothetical protein GVY35_14680 [Bacteroidetes bacterium]|jgi:hypothetical protein|nr:hypothetical protein [Bacteroidota bacterium]